MNLFIDTNILLSFYHLTNEDLEELHKLVVLVKSKEIHLYLPSQIEDEFNRNRANRIADGLKHFKDSKLPTQFPLIIRQYDEYIDLRKLIKQFDEKRNKILDRLNENITNYQLKADLVIHDLFQNAIRIKITDNMISKARLRMELGNPPGKKGSLGDALNWLAILQKVPIAEDIYFVSDDKDYFSPINSEIFNEFLAMEWQQEKKSALNFYKRLSKFLKEKFPEIKLASEAEKDLLIRNLASSPNFATTHSLIQQLSNFTEFTNSQLLSISIAAVSNNQIYWIIEDPDIADFFKNLIETHKGRADKDALLLLQTLLDGAMNKIEPAPWSNHEKYDDEEDDELPF